MFGAAAASWNAVPGRLPVHCSLSGEPDRWGGRLEGLLLLPIVALAIYLLLLGLPRIDPLRANYEAFAGAWGRIRLAMLATLAAFDGMIQLMIRGRLLTPMVMVPMVLGLFLIAVGSAIGDLRPNWFFGIRTHWALSSRRSWDATHRFGRRAFVAAGVGLLAAGLAGQLWAFVAALAFLVLAVGATVVISYRVWRDDPDRVPAAGVRRA